LSFTAVVLLLLSAVLHAYWNLAGKKSSPNTSFFLIASLCGLVCLSPTLWWGFFSIKAYSLHVVVLLVLTGFFQTLYYFGLAGAYRLGDLSVAYPMVRAIPILLVALINYFLGHSLQIHNSLGLFFLTLGILLLPVVRWKDLSFRLYQNKSTLYALVAAIGTTGYSLIDDNALRLLRSHGGNKIAVTSLYAFFETLSTAFFLALFIVLQKRTRDDWKTVWDVHFFQALFVGFFIALTYLIALIALAFTTNVSLVVAFRQSSILMGALVAMWWLKEPAPFPKIIGLSFLAFGLVLISI
jgi:drug/metabolite transporter (DMT)-like permease